MTIYVLPEIAWAQASQQLSPACFFSPSAQEAKSSPPVPCCSKCPGWAQLPTSTQLQAVAEMKATLALGARRKILCLRRYFEDADGD